MPRPVFLPSRLSSCALDIVECRRYESTTTDGRIALDGILFARRAGA